jgi:protease-4
MNFFKSFLSSCLGTIVALFAVTILGIILVSAFAAADEVSTIDEQSVLVLNLNGQITELELDDPIADLIPEASDRSMGLLQLTGAIRHAKEDSKIEGILLNTAMVGAGYASIEELREALIDFKTSGKWIIAYSDAYSEGAYYLSAVADKIFLNPNGLLEFNGLSAEVMFFKRLFDKLEIRPEVFRAGQFKSAVEPFIREDLSAENDLQLRELLGSIHHEMIRSISADRKIDTAQLEKISKGMLVREAADAVSYKLVDSLLYEDQMHDVLRSRIGLDKDEKISFVKYSAYRSSYEQKSESKSEIAVIVADGSIMPGKADNGVVGSKTINDALRRARTSDRVKAVVLRINSPGGSFTASDDMWREIQLTAKEKPVIASMSDYAASGGYFLAMACDTIVARPTTITGSIGVFSVLFDLSGLLNNKIGITTDEVKTGDFGNMFTVTRPLTEEEKNIWQKQTERVYKIFTGKAASGRDMKEEDLEKIASGRVWSGTQALENNLVDVLGGMNDAVRIAAQSAALGDDYRLSFYPKPKTFIEKLMSGADVEVFASDPLEKLAGPEEKILLRQWKRLQEYGGVQARMPVEFNIH